jgi:hypothetical protein
MHRIFSIVGLGAVGLLGYAVGHLGLTLFASNALGGEQSVALSVVEVQEAAIVSTPSDDQWPAIFGTYDPQPPGAVQPAETRRVQARYTLKGLFAGKISKWAIIEDASGEYLIREGDTLSDGETATQIDDTGVTIELDGEKSVINFEDG